MSAEINLFRNAKRAFGHVSSLVNKNLARDRSKAALRLANALVQASITLDGIAMSTGEERWDELRSLITDLGTICSWPNQPTLGAESILDRLLLPETENEVQQSLLSFSNSPESSQNEYVTRFTRFSRQLRNKPPRHHLGTSPATSLILQERSLDVNSVIYQKLYGIFGCHCGNVHENRLSLKSNIREQYLDAFEFDMLMQSFPPDDAPSPPNSQPWQDVQICVRMEAVRNRDGVAQVSNSNPAQLDVASVCKLVRDPRTSILRLEIGDAKLRRLPGNIPSRQRVDTGPSQPLRTILTTHRLSNKEKLILSYIITLSFWKYYDSQWMDIDWSSNSIHFFKQTQGNVEGTQSYLYANKPYVAVTPERRQDDRPFPEFAGADGICYRYPRILTLCIILLEIVSGRPLDVEHDETSASSINLQWHQANQIVHRDWRDFGDFEYIPFQSALKKCLEMKTFNVATDTSRKQLKGRRDVIFETLVEPLYRLIEGLAFLPALDTVDPIRARSLSNNPDQTLQEQVIQEDEDTWRSEWWLDQVSMYDHDVCLSFGCPQRKRIKVAVLDTGYDDQAEFFQLQERRDRIRFRDFTGSSSNPEDQAVDEHGHGTYTTSLIMKVAPTADIFVARIARNADDFENSTGSICQAIEHAAQKWGVDIISMSFGFTDYDLAIDNAMRNAEMFKEDRLLFFAAASNSGGNSREMFPARCDTAISIRQTDTYGRFLRPNPPIDRNGASVFGTLGHKVSSAWLSCVDGREFRGQRTESGSSVATAIAAGIAAMTLSHAERSYRSRFTPIPRLESLWTRAGMLAMFIHMSSDMDLRRQYLSPLRFYSDTHGAAETILNEMQHACRHK